MSLSDFSFLPFSRSSEVVLCLCVDCFLSAILNRDFHSWIPLFSGFYLRSSTSFANSHAPDFGCWYATSRCRRVSILVKALYVHLNTAARSVCLTLRSPFYEYIPSEAIATKAPPLCTIFRSVRCVKLASVLTVKAL